jgi:hypothetical protein
MEVEHDNYPYTHVCYVMFWIPAQLSDQHRISVVEMKVCQVVSKLCHAVDLLPHTAIGRHLNITQCTRKDL